MVNVVCWHLFGTLLVIHLNDNVFILVVWNGPAGTKTGTKFICSVYNMSLFFACWKLNGVYFIIVNVYVGIFLYDVSPALLKQLCDKKL